MKPCTTVLFLLAASLGIAEQPEWLAPLRKSEADIMQRMDAARKTADEEIAALGKGYLVPVAKNADDSMPPTEEGYATAVADSGLLYDRANARVTYLGNVRLNDARLQLRCKNRLYLQLSLSSMHEKEDEAVNAVSEDAAARNGKNAGGKKGKPAPAKAAEQQPTAKEKQTKPERTDKTAAAEPIIASAYDTMVDSVDNNVLMRSQGAEGMPHIINGGSEITLEPRKDGKDSYLLADSKGDAHLVSGKTTLRWKDKQGRPGILVAEQGRLEFNREHNALYIEGPTHITMPDGSTLSAKESLCVTLHPTPGSKPEPAQTFMAQFTSMDYDGVEKAVAKGDVVATRPALDGQPAAAVHGNICSYNGMTGECFLEGKDCKVTYDRQELRTQDRITLAPNGDITIHGDEVTGTYMLPTRPEQKTEPVFGSFRTPGSVHFRAADGTVSIPEGLQAKDPINHFTCTGPAVVHLKRAEKPAQGQRKSGMLNLAIADYKEISTIEASGNVDAYYMDTQKNQALVICGEQANFDLEHGTARVTAEAGQTAKMSYGPNTITTRSARTAFLSVNEQGDINVEGDTIHADLPFRDGHARVDCDSYLKLNRDMGVMEIGGHSKLVYPGGIMTANAPIFAELAPGEQVTKPAIPRYPHLSYNYSGVKQAETKQGGTLQTDKASMQCRGPITVLIAPPDGKSSKKGKDDADVMRRVTAKAYDNVAVLAKDAGGRLFRATGDTLTIDGASGVKVLTGATVSLSDSKNTHTASGKGARIVVDANNNARITGERQFTTATRLRDQMGDKDKKKP